MSRALAAVAILALSVAPAIAETFVGPSNSFTLEFDGDWSVIQAQNRGGVVCTETACGKDRVACLVLPRSDEAAKPGKPLPDMLVDRFGDRLVSMPPAGMKSEYVEKFAARTIGDVSGSWAEIRSSGEKPSVHFGLFLFAAPGFDIALSCGSPEGSWPAHKARIEKLLGSVKLGAVSEAPPAVGPQIPGAQLQPR
ncbi:hypothetical protein ACFQI3_12405 [Hansschlegelia quercus]|uniref:Invasion associated locus B family protein n=1 Tax=Hansschlegelia quercus TaxID=2528245 RepID=A0A4Q9GND6_9HYPH|nr:hypothetical protein [Hansschlegelia quercus]TBN53350.1 hypothetical protein EYR15_10035 [Hansschlegelia quercus]